MQIIASGFISGSPSYHIIFSNIIIGKILQVLYLTNMNVNWYTLYLYLIHLIGSTLLFYILLKRNGNNIYWGFFLFMVFFLFFEVRFLLLLQFTTTAFVIGLAGMLLLLSKEKSSIALPILGGLCLLISGLIRFQVLFPIIAVFSPLIVTTILKKKYHVIIILAVFMTISYGFNRLDRYIYLSDPEWQHFTKYNSMRGRLHHNTLFKFDDNCRAQGWSENDYFMFTNWFFEDENVYSLDKLTNLYSKIKINGQDIVDSMRLFLNHVTFKILRFSIAFLLYILFLISTRDWKTKILITIQGGLTFVLMFASSIKNLPKDRVILSLLICFIFVLYTELDWNKIAYDFKNLFRRRFVQYTIALIGIMIISIFLINEKKLSDERGRQSEGFMNYFSCMNDKDVVFVLWGSLITFESLSPFSTLLNKYNPHFYFSGWSSFSPGNRAFLKKYGEDDIYHALLNNDKFYLVQNRKKSVFDHLRLYYQEHFGINITSEENDFCPEMRKSIYFVKLKKSD